MHLIDWKLTKFRPWTDWLAIWQFTQILKLSKSFGKFQIETSKMWTKSTGLQSILINLQSVSIADLDLQIGSHGL